VVAEPEVFAPVFVVAEPEVFAPVFAVAEPEVFAPVFAVAEPEVFAPVFAVAELSPEVVLVVDLEVSEPEVVLVVDLEVSEPGVLLVAVVSTAHVSGPQASVGIPVVFDVLVPVSGVAVEVDSPRRPRFLAFPSVDCYASPSSSVQVVGEESVHSSTGAHTNYGLCSILSNLGLHQNKNLEHCYNNPSPGYNNVNDTNALPKNATTNHPRNRSLHQCQGQHRHMSQVTLLTLVVREI